MNDNIIFCNHLLKLTKQDKEEQGYSVGKLTVYKYGSIANTYQVYEEKEKNIKTLGDFNGSCASEAKVNALNFCYPDKR